jgi:hypothetical protein
MEGSDKFGILFTLGGAVLLPVLVLLLTQRRTVTT